MEASLCLSSYYYCNSKVYEPCTQTKMSRETKVREMPVIKDQTTVILNQPCKTNNSSQNGWENFNEDS